MFIDNSFGLFTVGSSKGSVSGRRKPFLLDLYFEYHVVIFIVVCSSLKAIFAEC